MLDRPRGTTVRHSLQNVQPLTCSCSHGIDVMGQVEFLFIGDCQDIGGGGFGNGNAIGFQRSVAMDFVRDTHCLPPVS